MFPTLIRRAGQRAPTPQEYIARIRQLYPPKKVWPPDYKRLSPQEQLKYEKKYKRRTRLAMARPRWDKSMKLIQLFSIVSVLVYAVLVMDWEQPDSPQKGSPFDGLRQTLWNAFGSDYSASKAKPVKNPSESLPHARS